MNLEELLKGCEITRVLGNSAVEVKGITSDSRNVGRGFLFAAIKGLTYDGHLFIEDALKRGACALIIDQSNESSVRVPDNITTVIVPDGRKIIGLIAGRFYGEPSRRIKLVGVTGTNGKTTVTYLLESIIKAAGFSPGVIGTVNCRYNGSEYPASRTTPEAETLQQLMAQMIDCGITHCIMEVSSHALDQERVSGCYFDTAVFTNLTIDHLDYHGTMAHYGSVKERLFIDLPLSEKVSVVNIDDPYGQLLAEKVGNVITYSLNYGDISPHDIMETEKGLTGVLHSPVGEIKLASSLIGEYNVSNIMAAVGGAVSLGIDRKSIEEGIRALERVPGRIERVKIPADFSDCRTFIDYAHTPDALERIIRAIKPTTKGRLITIFGCGGDRDASKRPLMGQIAASESDYTIVTSDNPRNEDPLSIIKDIEKGIIECGEEAGRRYTIISDRRKAIAEGVRIMNKGDTLLIAGKGHEDYQIIGDKKIYFDDADEAEQAFLERAKTSGAAS